MTKPNRFGGQAKCGGCAGKIHVLIRGAQNSTRGCAAAFACATGNSGAERELRYATCRPWERAQTPRDPDGTRQQELPEPVADAGDTIRDDQ